MTELEIIEHPQPKSEMLHEAGNFYSLTVRGKYGDHEVIPFTLVHFDGSPNQWCLVDLYNGTVRGSIIVEHKNPLTNDEFHQLCDEYGFVYRKNVQIVLK